MASLCGVAAATVVTIMPAAAAVSNCGPPQSSTHFDGYHQEPNSYGFEGARADIVTRTAALCSTDTTNGRNGSNFSNEWSMIANDYNATGGGWAQSGIETDYGYSGMYYFAQQYQGNNGPMVTVYSGSATATGQTHLYTQWWDPACGCLHSDVDSTLYLVSSWNPYAYWTLPFAPTFMGEAGYLANDIAGTASSPTQFTQLGGERDDNDQWESYPCGILSSKNDGSATRSDGKHWYLQAATCPSFNNYTK